MSAYHALHEEGFGRESRPTLLHTFRADRANHIDYIFLPETWIGSVGSVEVGDPQRWIRELKSDHAPVILALSED